MSFRLALAILAIAFAPPRPSDDDPSDRATFAEIARRVAAEVEKIEDPGEKAEALYDLAHDREVARDIEGAKSAYARAVELMFSKAESRDEEYKKFFLLNRLAGAQKRLGEQPASAATLARAREAAMELKDEFFKLRFLEMILDSQREQEDRDAVAETARRMAAIIKAQKPRSFEPREQTLLGLRAKAGDVRGALQALLEMPAPSEDLPLGKPMEARRDEFRGRVLGTLAMECHPGDEEALSQVAKAIRNLRDVDSRNTALRSLVWAQARLKQFDEASRSANEIDLKAETIGEDPRHELIDVLLDLADDQQRAHDDVGALRSAQRVAEVLASFEKEKDRTDEETAKFRARFPHRDAPLPRLALIYARAGERAEAMGIVEKLPPKERLKALEEIADLDDDAGHREDALSARTAALKLAKEILIEIDAPKPEEKPPAPKPREKDAPPETEEEAALRKEIEALRKKVEGEDESPEARALKEAAERKKRREETTLAMVRLYARMGDLSRADELIKDSGDAKPERTKAVIHALGQSGDAKAALARIDTMTDPRVKVEALSQLASGLRDRRQGRERRASP